jgi:peptidyl-prolyl cis-trans isomerase B (cyclophilin B)
MRDSPSVDSPAVPKATKRERQRQNREIRREAMLAAERRRKRLRTARALAIPLLVLVAIFAIIQVTRGGDDGESSAPAITCTDRKPATPVKEQTFPEAPPLDIDVNAEYSVVMHTSCGDIDVKLDPKQAPQTVNSFLYLVKNEYYNGTTFPRIVTDFVDQGGSQTNDTLGTPGYTLPDEPPKNGYKAGDVAMANSGPGTTGSQFFLVVSKNGAQQLNAGGAPYKYSILGHMDAHGLRVAKKINTFGSPNEAGTPTKTIYLFDVGIVYGNAPTTTTGAATTTTAEATTTTVAP